MTAPVVNISIPRAAAAELLALIDRYPEAVAGEHRVAVRVALQGAIKLGHPRRPRGAQV